MYHLKIVILYSNGFLIYVFLIFIYKNRGSVINNMNIF